MSSEAKETAGVPLGITKTEPQKLSGEQGVKQQQQPQQQQPLKEGEQTAGAGEGIHILPVQREISGLLKEGHGQRTKHIICDRRMQLSSTDEFRETRQ